MNQINIIGDTAKERRIDYDLIDRLNKQYEAKARKQELKGRLAGKKKKEEEKEEPAAEPAQAPDITYIKTPDELREIKGNYSLHKGMYMIDFEIIVPQGNTLILQPGAALYFTKNAGIICRGRFEAKGETGLEVLLTAENQQDGWKNLYLKGGAEAIIDDAIFSCGKGRTNHQQGNINGGAALLEAENGLNHILRINNSCFENNSANGCGGVIYNYQGTLDIDESKNTFIGNKPDDISEE